MSGLGEKEERTMGEGEKNARGTGGNLLLCCVPFFLPFNILRDFLLLFSFRPSVLSSKLSVAVYSSSASYDPI